MDHNPTASIAIFIGLCFASLLYCSHCLAGTDAPIAASIRDKITGNRAIDNRMRFALDILKYIELRLWKSCMFVPHHPDIDSIDQ